MDINVNFPWFETWLKSLQQANSQAQLKQGILLNLSRADGSESFIYQLAQMLLCENSSKKACLRCKSCLYPRDEHPNFIQIQAESSQIKVEQIRSMIERSQVSAGEHQKKVVALYDAHLMNISASNALLKILEEPPMGYQLILATSHISALSKTIVSRCQHFICRAPSQALVHDYFQQCEGSKITKYFWLLDIVDGAYDFLGYVKNQKLEELNGLKQSWVSSLSNKRVESELIQLTQTYPTESWKVLFFLMRKKVQSEVIQNQDGAESLLSWLQQLTEQRHAFLHIPNLHYDAWCQQIISGYQQVINS